MKTKTYYARVKIEWTNFGIEAKSISDAVKVLKAQYKEQYGIDLDDQEILEITEE